MRVIAGGSEGASRSGVTPLGVLRLARVAVALMLGVLVLIVPHLLWRSAWPHRPSPVARLYLRVVCAAAGIRLRRRGVPIAKNALLVANHISWADILALGGSARVTFVAKSEVRGWPALGWLARLAPTLFVRREGRGEARAQSETITGALRHGPVVLFAEGTTSDGSRVLPFRSTLFAATRRIQPIAITYDPPPGASWTAAERDGFAWDGDKPFLPHVLAVVASGGAICTIDVLPLIEGCDRKALAVAARDAIVAARAR